METETPDVNPEMETPSINTEVDKTSLNPETEESSIEPETKGSNAVLELTGTSVNTEVKELPAVNLEVEQPTVDPKGNAEEKACGSSVIRHPESCVSQGKPDPEFRPPRDIMEMVRHDITYGKFLYCFKLE
uniref:Uncharacterized protein n=1 Tax=Cacopsylla melanoneura TaxID=428564 RepID=A0A8D8QIK8_9HEMI